MGELPECCGGFGCDKCEPQCNEIDRLRADLAASQGRIAQLEEALREIAEEEKVYKGHGDYDIVPALTDIESQTLARQVLTSTPSAAEKGGEG